MLVCMQAPQQMGGQDIYSTWAYRKIVPSERIEFIHNLADKDGNKVDPVQLGMPPDFPDDVQHLVLFRSLGDKTEMTVTEFGWTPGQMRNLAKWAWGNAWTKCPPSSTQARGEATHPRGWERSISRI